MAPGARSPPSTCTPACTACAQHLQRYGGHRAAAGLTTAASDLPALAEAFRAHADGVLADDDLHRPQRVDADSRAGRCLGRAGPRAGPPRALRHGQPRARPARPGLRRGLGRDHGGGAAPAAAGPRRWCPLRGGGVRSRRAARGAARAGPHRPRVPARARRVAGERRPSPGGPRRGSRRARRIGARDSLAGRSAAPQGRDRAGPAPARPPRSRGRGGHRAPPGRQRRADRARGRRRAGPGRGPGRSLRPGAPRRRPGRRRPRGPGLGRGAARAPAPRGRPRPAGARSATRRAWPRFRRPSRCISSTASARWHSCAAAVAAGTRARCWPRCGARPPRARRWTRTPGSRASNGRTVLRPTRCARRLPLVLQELGLADRRDGTLTVTAPRRPRRSRGLADVPGPGRAGGRDRGRPGTRARARRDPGRGAARHPCLTPSRARTARGRAVPCGERCRPRPAPNPSSSVPWWTSSARSWASTTRAATATRSGGRSSSPPSATPASGASPASRSCSIRWASPGSAPTCASSRP